MSRRAAGAALVAAALAAGLMTAPAAPVRAADPAGTPGRLAFTDAQDSVRRVELTQVEGPAYPEWDPGDVASLQEQGEHSGEASATVAWPLDVNLGYSFVSTRPTVEGDPPADDPDGEVWIQMPDWAGAQVLQVTDDDADQTHPVAWQVSPCQAYYGGGDIDVAFASDRSGNWDIWVVRLERVVGDEPFSCTNYRITEPQQVTDHPGDDLWPAWAYDRLTNTRSLVFSSTRSDPRGDLYQVPVDPGALDELPAPASAFTQLTDGPAADSTPAVRLSESVPVVCPGDPDRVTPRWLAFTRASEEDPRGGLAVLDLDDPGGGVLGLGVTAASQPAWSPDGDYLAYRSTAGDPDGSVRIDRFVRTCPTDLEVQSLTVDPSTQEVDRSVDVTLTVVNNSPRVTSGQVTVDFSDLLEPPAECAGERVCTLDVPELAESQTRVWRWTSAQDAALDPLTTGTGEITATVAVGDGQPDAVPGNDRRSVSVTIAPPEVDVAISDFEGAAVYASPSLATFGTGVTTIPITVTVYLENPDTTRSVDVVVSVTSDNGLVRAAGGSLVATSELTLDPGGSPSVDLAFTASRPSAVGDVVVDLTAVVTVEPPIVDPRDVNNSGTTTTTLRVPPPASGPVVNSVLGPGSPALAGLHRLLGPGSVRSLVTHAEGIARATAASLGAAVRALRAAGAVPAAVPDPVKPPVADAVSLVPGRVVADTFGGSEGQPSFSLLLVEVAGDPPYSEEVTTLLITVRPLDTRVSDVLSTDGSGRRVLAEVADHPTGQPSYAPDGRFVAYQRYTCDEPSVVAVGCDLVGSDIVVARADGSGPAVIYPASDPRPEGAIDLNPAWSPDGGRIAFTRVVGGDEADPPSLWLADGFDVTTADPGDADLIADSATQLTQPRRATQVGQIGEWDDEAAWSPDGTRIAYTRGRFDTSRLTGLEPGDTIPEDRQPTLGDHDSDIWVRELGAEPGSDEPLLAQEIGASGSDPGCPETEDSVCVGGDDRGADWSPDGAEIVYEHTGWLYLADPEDRSDLGPVTGPRAIASGGGGPVYPDDAPATPPEDPESEQARSFPGLDWAQDAAWSPDGGEIAFSGQPRGQPDRRGVYTLTLPDDPGEREIRQVAQQPQPELAPDWQPTADLAVTMVAVPPTVAVGVPAALTAAVANEGPSPALAASVTITVPAQLTAGALPAGCTAGPPITCALGTLAPGASLTRSVPVTGATVGAFDASAATTSATHDGDPADNTATARVNVGETPPTTLQADVQVALVVDPDPGYVGGEQRVTATVTNAGPNTSAVALTMSAPAASGPPEGDACFASAGCSLGDVVAGARVTRTFTLTAREALEGDVTARVSGSVVDVVPANNGASVQITVLQPVLGLLPPLGPPGFVTRLVGTDFPPRARVRLTWTPGLNASTAPVRVRRDGTFDVAMPVLFRDQLGPRLIMAVRVSGLEFSDVEAQFLVVPRTQQPPSMGRG